MNRKLVVSTIAAVGLAGFGAAPALAALSAPDVTVSRDLAPVAGPSLGAQSADVPAVSTPALGGPLASRTQVAPVGVATPGIASQSARTQPIPVPATCAGPLACVGAFTVPALNLANTPTIASRNVATPALNIPAVCPAWPCSGVDAGGFTVKLTPAINTGTLTPAISFDVALTNIVADATAASGSSLGRVGPVSQTIRVPGIGAVPLTLFPAGIDLPNRPGVAATADLMLAVNVGNKTYSVSKAINL